MEIDYFVPLPLQPGQRPPLAVNTETDQRGALYVTGGIVLALTAICLVVRAYVRIGWNQTLGSDDYAIGAAFVFLIGQTVVLFEATGKGLGLRTDLLRSDDSAPMQKAVLAVEILGFLVEWSSKASSLLFYMRLSRDRKSTWIWQMMLISTAALALVCILTVSLRCDLGHSWLFFDQQCTGLYERWIAVTALDAVFELLLFLQPFSMVLGLQMRTKVKVKVLSAFAWRLLILVPLFLRLSKLPQFYKTTEGQTVSSRDVSLPWIYGQITLALSIITPTIPMLQPFMRATATTFGMVSGSATNSYGNTTKDKLRSGGRWSKQGSSRVRTDDAMELRSLGDEQDRLQLRPAFGRGKEHDPYTVSVVPGSEGKRSESGSDISQRPIIRRDVDIHVSYGEGPSS